LKFLGNIDPAQVEDITEAMGRSSLGASSFRLLLSGLGAFPNENRPRVIWAGVQGDLESVGKLQAGIEAAVFGLGFPREKRPFTSHLTLGRVRDQATSGERLRVGAAVSSYYSMGPTEPWLVESVRLVRSNLGPGGATYSDLASVSLGDGAGPRQ
jgi:2'-5' RNA ligase